MYWAEKQKVLPFQVGLGPKNAIRENLDAIFVNVEKVIPKFIQFASYNPVIRIMESDLIECKKENLCN